MKKCIISLVMAVMVLVLLIPAPLYAAEAGSSTNLMPDGSFETDSGKWGLYTESGGKAVTSIGDGVLTVEIASPGRRGHAVQVYCDGFEMIQGAKYKISFDINSTIDRIFEWRVQLNGGDYHAYAGVEEETLTAGDNSFSYEFTMEEESDPAPRFAFNIGDNYERQGLGEHVIIIDNVILELTDSSGAVTQEEEVKGPSIAVNQVGYTAVQDKKAAIAGIDAGTKFYVVNADDAAVAFEGLAEEEKNGGSSDTKTLMADFSEITDPGTYLIRLEDGTESPVFTIGNDVYGSLLTDSVRMFYLQRCGMKLTEETAGDFAHDVCHDQSVQIYDEDGQLEAAGGWHDAGDYGRYTVAGAKAAADLMLAFENYPELFADESGILESGNGIPDILDETRYELEWLMKLQTEEGGVYHKITGLNFDNVVMPDECTEELYAFAVSPSATADFAAVMYMAARVYKDIDPEFSETALTSAEKALSYYMTISEDNGFTNPWNCNTGEYPDTSSEDEYLWAICEGYKTTQGAELAGLIEAYDFSVLDDTAFGWQNVAEYGMYAYLTAGQELSGYEQCKSMFIAKADSLVDIVEADSFGSSISDDYPWGSNMTIANNGMLLSIAADLTGDEAYLLAAEEQLNYLLGVNVLGYCYVTGYGQLSPESTHHRPSQTLGTTMKGMLVGGPNSDLEDPYAQQVLKDSAKAACYVDNEQSYSCNEITIYWNSPFVFLLSAVSAE